MISNFGILLYNSSEARTCHNNYPTTIIADRTSTIMVLILHDKQSLVSPQNDFTAIQLVWTRCLFEVIIYNPFLKLAYKI